MKKHLKAVIVRYHDDETHIAHSTKHEGYNEYIDKHGAHFSDALAEHISRLMVNANGSTHSWTVAQIKKTMAEMNLALPKDATYGDITYAANMYFADLYPEALKDEASCIKAAYKIANDPDGYNGMLFHRWATDVEMKGDDIDLKEFI